MANTDQTQALIIEDDAILRRSLQRALTKLGWQVGEAEDVGSAVQALKARPALVVLDVNLPDGDGVDLAGHIAQLRPMPLTLAISGQASAEQAFRLKALGVNQYLAKPFSLQEFEQAIEALADATPDLTPHVLPLLGKQGLRELNTQVRRDLLEQALSRSAGNKTKAAELLGVTRQAVQQMLREFDINSEQFKP